MTIKWARPVDCQLKKFVVSYIAAGGNALGYVDRFRRRHQLAQPIPEARADQRHKARPGQGDEQLLFSKRGFEEQMLSGDEMKRHLLRRIFL